MLKYTSQKGFCEDLDEGKYSLPLIHLIASMPSNYLLRNILTQRRVNEQQRVEHKLTILNMMKESGSLDFTKEVIKSLRDIVQAEIQELEEKTGTKNFELKMIMEKLKV